MKTTFSLAALLAGIVVAGCSGTSQPGDTTGLSLPGPYYNLVPGQCAEFDDDGGFGPTVGLQIKSSVSPPGIELQRTLHGAVQEIDYLTIDAGMVFILERELQGQSAPSQDAFASPLAYLPHPPLAIGGAQLSTTSTCASGSDCATMNLTVFTADSRPYTGPGSVPDGGMTEYKVNFGFNEATATDAGVETVETWITPGIGFTDLFLQSDNNGGFTDYKLVDIVTDGGPCAAH